MFYPIIRNLMTDPRDMGKAGPQGQGGMIYAGDHKTCYILNI